MGTDGKQSKKIGSFAVFQRMADLGDNDLKLAPMNNIVSVNYHHKRGTDVTFGVEGNIAFQIEKGELVGGFLFCPRKRFLEVKELLESEANSE